MSGPDFDQWQTDLLAEVFSAVSVLQAGGPVDIIVGLIPVHRGSGDPGTPTAVEQTNALLAAQATAAAPGAPCDSWGRCATVAYAAATFAHDGVHPGTLLQGLMANEFLLVLNDLQGTSILLLTDAEMFAAAVPEPSTGLLVASTLMALAIFRRGAKATRR